MALQSSGQITLGNIAGEFGGSAPHALSEYYGAASGVPTSGQIRLAADFYGKANLATFSTGSEQTVTVTGSGWNEVSAGNIVVGAMINGSATQNGIKYRAVTVNNGTGSYGSSSTTTWSICGGQWADFQASSGSIFTGKQHNVDETYVGSGGARSKTFSVSGYTNSWSGQSSSSSVNHGSWTYVTTSAVTESASMTCATGVRYWVAGGSCGRLHYDNVQLSLYYRTITLS